MLAVLRSYGAGGRSDLSPVAAVVSYGWIFAVVAREGRTAVVRGGRSSGSDDLAHGVMEVQAQDLDLEVDGIALEVALGPAPIRFFDEEAGEGGQLEVARLLFDELEAAFLQERDQRGPAGGADLFRSPALGAVVHGEDE